MTRYPQYLALVFLTALFSTGASASEPATAADHAADAASVLEAKMALRDLWVEHVFWIRSYVLAAHAQDAAQRDAAEAEVVANARALAQSVAPFYGASAADDLFDLLAGHWAAVRSFSTATLERSAVAQQGAVDDLTANARQIAVFLSGANPYLPEDAVFGLLSAHGAHHVAQINQIDAEDFAGEAATWHDMRRHMFVIADAIADALARQFPENF
jgi:hypothetical protein